MTGKDYLRILVEEIHSTTVATIGKDGHPQTRVIDMMLWDDKGVYFLTAKGKDFYAQLLEQGYIALSATKNKISISLRGRVKNKGNDKLDEIFEKNPYMKSIYPGDTRVALEVFFLYEATGEYFDISKPEHILRDDIVIGTKQDVNTGYQITDCCTGCRRCYAVCPQKCIDITKKPALIDQHHCLHCGLCVEVCPIKAIEVSGKSG